MQDYTCGEYCSQKHQTQHNSTQHNTTQLTYMYSNNVVQVVEGTCVHVYQIVWVIRHYMQLATGSRKTLLHIVHGLCMHMHM